MSGAANTVAGRVRSRAAAAGAAFFITGLICAGTNLNYLMWLSWTFAVLHAGIFAGAGRVARKLQ